MIKKIAAAAVIATGVLSFVAVAQAEDFPAAPMNSGPAAITGFGPIGDIANVALLPVNVLTSPLVGPAPAAVVAPRVRRHHRRHFRRAAR